MTNLCRAMAPGTLAVHDAVFSPSQFLYEVIVGNLRKYVGACASAHGTARSGGL